MKKQLFILLFILVLQACELIDFHPYDSKLSVEEKNINGMNIPRIELATSQKDTIRFAFFGDTQRSYDETEDFVKHINARKDEFDFLIHGGDYTEFGTTAEYEWNAEILSKLEIPYVGLIGNHDVLGNGDLVFMDLFGKDDFSFVAGGVKFVCLNTNALEYDYSNPVPDFEFILSELRDSIHQYDRTVIAMHAPPGSDQFNNNVKEVFQDYIRKFPSLQFCVHAHNHQVQVRDIFGDGIIYYGCSNMGKRNYLVFTITPNSYTYETIDF